VKCSQAKEDVDTHFTLFANGSLLPFVL